MPSHPTRFRTCLCLATAAYLALCWFATGSASQPRLNDPEIQPYLVPEFQYLGNASCSGTECHTADKAAAHSGQMIGDEANIWAEADPHALAYETLASTESKKIATALTLSSAAQSDRCLSCHAMNPPPAQRGEKFSLVNAVGCEACHGPAQKWLEPHKAAGWTLSQRNSIGADGLLKQFGLVDTSNLHSRSTTCVSCHLRIDKDMIDAGHPPLEFEQYAYDYYVSKKPDREYRQHWGEGIDPPTYWDAKLWAAGQFAACDASAAQVAEWKSKGWDTADAESLAAIYSGGVAVAKKCLGVENAKAVIDAQLTPAKAAAAAVELAAMAPSVKNQIQRRILTNGVAALTSSAYDEAGKELPDAFWDSYDAALEASDAATFKTHLDAMAAIAGEIK